MKRKYKYNIGDKVYCKDGSFNIILDKTIGNRGESAYVCKCNKNHISIKTQNHIANKCCYCLNQKVSKGINDISTTNPDMFSMIVDEEFAYTHHQNSTEITQFRCPVCNFIIEKSPAYVKNHGLRCPHCSGGYSYGEKLMMNLLDELNIKYINQFSSKNQKWCKRYQYDFYLCDFDCIIEVHGMQHYKDTTWNTYEMEHKNDIAKMNLAKKNIKTYIIIDARKSELDYIKHSILDGELASLLDLPHQNINWDRIHKNAVSPIINIIVDKYNNYSKNISDISNILHLSNPTIVHYLKEASKLNMCDYDSELKINSTLINNHKMNSERGSKPIICLEDSKLFRNAKILQEMSESLYGTKLDTRAVSAVCNKKRKKYKNLTFEFVTRKLFNEMKEDNPDLVFGDKFTIMKDVV